MVYSSIVSSSTNKSPPAESTLLQVALDYLQTITPSQAAELDRNSEALRIALQELGDRQLLGLRIPQAWGGAEFSATDFQKFRMGAARYSGALAFLQTQHQSAGAFLSASRNECLKQVYLPDMSRGRKLVGVGFSHLRRPGSPAVKATPVEDGYQVSGTVPWVTGWNLFDEFVLGATLPSGEAFYGLVPLRSQASIHCSDPLALGGMSGTNTVQVELQDYFLPSDRMLFTRAEDAIHQSDRRNVLHHSFMALGCAQAALDCLVSTQQQKSLPFLTTAYETLQGEWSLLCQETFAALDDPQSTFADKLQHRAAAIHLMNRCAQATVTAASGAANLLDHPAQRIYREALCFMVSGQTSAVMAASLAQLAQAQLTQAQLTEGTSAPEGEQQPNPLVSGTI